MLIEDILDMVGTCIYYIHDLLVPLLNMPIKGYQSMRNIFIHVHGHVNKNHRAKLHNYNYVNWVILKYKIMSMTMYIFSLDI